MKRGSRKVVMFSSSCLLIGLYLLIGSKSCNTLALSLLCRSPSGCGSSGGRLITSTCFSRRDSMGFRLDTVTNLLPDIMSVSSARGSMASLTDSKTFMSCQEGRRCAVLRSFTRTCLTSSSFSKRRFIMACVDPHLVGQSCGWEHFSKVVICDLFQIYLFQMYF